MHQPDWRLLRSPDQVALTAKQRACQERSENAQDYSSSLMECTYSTCSRHRVLFMTHGTANRPRADRRAVHPTGRAVGGHRWIDAFTIASIFPVSTRCEYCLHVNIPQTRSTPPVRTPDAPDSPPIACTSMFSSVIVCGATIPLVVPIVDTRVCDGRNHMSRRVAVIGLDCAEPSLVFERWRDELPTFRALM